MDVQIKINNNCLLVTMGGELDHHSSEEAREKVDKFFERSGCRNIIFDFTRVTFMDSSGIGMIIGRYKNTEKCGGILSIVGMNDELSRIFHLSGLAKIVRCYASLADAEQAAV